MIEKAKFNVNFNILMCLNRTIHPIMLHTLMEAHVLILRYFGEHADSASFVFGKRREENNNAIPPLCKPKNCNKVTNEIMNYCIANPAK